MRAITYTRFGDAKDVLSLEDIATPDPGPGEVRVRLHSSGVNPSDIRARAGGRPGVTEPPFPKIIPHSDGAGVIDSVGAGTDPSRLGERVWIWNGQWQRAFGTAAEYICLPAAQAVPLPDTVSFEEGAVLGIPGVTAFHTVLSGGSVAGKTLLVSGGAGTVAHLAIQIAVASGATVLATARGEAGFAEARAAGASAVFDYRDDHLADAVLEETKGRPIDRIIEVEFGQNVETNTKIIAERGTIVAYGSARDMTPTLPFYPLMFKAVTIELALIYLLTPSERAAVNANIQAFLKGNKLDMRISHVLPLEQCAEAHELIASGNRTGSVVLKI